MYSANSLNVLPLLQTVFRDAGCEFLRYLARLRKVIVCGLRVPESRGNRRRGAEDLFSISRKEGWVSPCMEPSFQEMVLQALETCLSDLSAFSFRQIT